jgi:hypothetical protein
VTDRDINDRLGGSSIFKIRMTVSTDDGGSKRITRYVTLIKVDEQGRHWGSRYDIEQGGKWGKEVDADTIEEEMYVFRAENIVAELKQNLKYGNWEKVK